jgi:hypothetical protein
MSALGTIAEPRRDFEAALRSDDPYHAMKVAGIRLLNSGWTKPSLLLVLDNLREALETTGRDDDLEVVLDVMDAFAGWVAPQDVVY